MRLVIDCFKLIKGTGKSIGIYNVAKNIVQNLAKDADKPVTCSTSGTAYKNTIIVLGNKYNKADFDIPGVKFVCVKYNPNDKVICLLWELFLVNIALKKLRPDRVLFPRGFAPLFNRTENVVLIHDMIPFYYDKHYPGVLGKTNKYIMWRLLASARHASKVITVSEYSKKDIMKIAKISSDKIAVIHNGLPIIGEVEDKYGYAAYPGDIRSITMLPDRPYICAVTSSLPHKNADGIIKAYRAYCKMSRNPMDLVIIGLGDLSNYKLDLDVESRITYFKYLPNDSDMHNVIKKSQVFLFASKQEGFGLPPLEAMALGVPVVCSDSSSLPEVVGDAAITVDCDDEIAIAEGLICMEKPELREEYIAKGYKNIRRFTWDAKIQDYRKILLG